MDELLELTRENNAMLKRICAWLDKIESKSYREGEDMRGFVQNVAANMLTERIVNNGFPAGQSMGVNNPINQQSNNQQTFWR